MQVRRDLKLGDGRWKELRDKERRVRKSDFGRDTKNTAATSELAWTVECCQLAEMSLTLKLSSLISHFWMNDRLLLVPGPSLLLDCFIHLQSHVFIQAS